MSREEKYEVRESILQSNLRWMKENKGNSLHDYGEVIRHLLNEVAELKSSQKLREAEAWNDGYCRAKQESQEDIDRNKH